MTQEIAAAQGCRDARPTQDQPYVWKIWATTGDTEKPWRGQKGYCTGPGSCWQFWKDAHEGGVYLLPPCGQMAVRVQTHQPGPKMAEINGNSPKNSEQMLY